MIIATCGHVDHGKTQLVHALTGVKTDRLEEEQQRGLTIDLGFAYADISGNRMGFIDVPGHIRFIDNMLAGVSIIDFGLLVVAADDGPMPQTREHLAILELLHINDGAVVLTKTDRVEEQRIAAVRAEIEALLANTSFAGKPVYPVSSVTGQGLSRLTAALADAAASVPVRPEQGHFRLAIDRAFTIKGSGIVVTGSVFSGKLDQGDELLLMPGARKVRVRTIHRQNQPSPSAVAGDRCAVNISGPELEREMIHRGNWLTTNPAPPTDRADAEVRVLADQTAALRHWTPVHVHTAANHVTGRVATLEAGKIDPGQTGLVQLVLSREINLCRGDRLILRDQAALNTIGGGIIIDPWSPRRGRAKAERIERLALLRADTVRDRFNGLLRTSPLGLDTVRFRQAENLTDDEWRNLITETPELIVIGEQIITVRALEALAGQVVGQIAQWHNQHPDQPGLNRQQIRQSLPLRLTEPLLDEVIDHLIEAGKLLTSGSILSLPGHALRLTPQEETLWKRIEPILAESWKQPPVVHDLAKQLAKPHATVRQVLTQCMRLGYVVRPVENRFFLPQALESLEAQVIDLANAADEGLFTVRDYRDASGIGRNLCIELLEYFDRTGLTLRIGDNRKLARSG